MKTCSKHPDIPSTSSNRCKECNKEYQRKWYLSNKELQNNRSRETNRKARQRKREYVYQILLLSKCAKCEERDPAVLQFDHLDPSIKIDGISKMMFSTKYKLKDIQDEINKCQVLCANCHARKTAADNKWYQGMEHLQAGVSPHSYKV